MLVSMTKSQNANLSRLNHGGYRDMLLRLRSSAISDIACRSYHGERNFLLDSN